jgi:hypothetical protein
MMTESNHPSDYELDTIDELGLDRRQTLAAPQDGQDSIFSTVDDETMVRRFARGKKRSVSNHNLTIKYSHNSLQLSTPQGELIALNKISDKLHYILLKQDSRYWEFIHHIVLEHSFVPISDQAPQGGFTRYQKYQIPSGYSLKYTDGAELLQFWQQRSTQSGQQLDLLFLNKTKWHRVKSAQGEGSKLSLAAVAGQIDIPLTNRVAWIYQLTDVPTSADLPPATTSRHLPPNDQSELLDKLSAKLSVDNGDNSTADFGGGVDADALALFEQIFNSRDFSQLSPALQDKVQDLQAAAIAIVENYIDQGEKIVKTEVITDTSGKTISEKTITIQRGCPRWVLETLLNSINDRETTDLP